MRRETFELQEFGVDEKAFAVAMQVFESGLVSASNN